MHLSAAPSPIPVYAGMYVYAGDIPLGQKPALKHLVANCVHIAAKDTWYDVGLQLGFSPDKLNTIQVPPTCQGWCKKMFQCWLNGEPHTGNKAKSWETVLQAVATVFGEATYYQIQDSLAIHSHCGKLLYACMYVDCLLPVASPVKVKGCISFALQWSR